MIIFIFKIKKKNSILSLKKCVKKDKGENLPNKNVFLFFLLLLKKKKL